MGDVISFPDNRVERTKEGEKAAKLDAKILVFEGVRYSSFEVETEFKSAHPAVKPGN